MAIIPPPPLGSYPNCATHYLYKLGDLYYYQTVDCKTNAIGYGVLDRLVNPGNPACNADGTCPPGLVVTPINLLPRIGHQVAQIETTLASNFNKLLETLSNTHHKFARHRAFRRDLFDFLNNHFLPRANQPGRDDRISPARKELADYLVADVNTFSNPGGYQPAVNVDHSVLSHLLDLPEEVGDIYLRSITREFESARCDSSEPNGDTMIARDIDFEIEGINSGDFSRLYDRNTSYTNNPTEVLFGGQNKRFVKMRPYLQHGRQVDVFFRFLKFTGTVNNKPFTHFVGQQVEVPLGGLPQQEIAAMNAVKFDDRHRHFHVVQGQPDGEGAQRQMLAYSTTEIANNEYFA